MVHRVSTQTRCTSKKCRDVVRIKICRDGACTVSTTIHYRPNPTTFFSSFLMDSCPQYFLIRSMEGVSPHSA